MPELEAGPALTGHYFSSVDKMGWSGVTNGQLLALAEQNSFDVFLTGHRNLSFQQNVAHQRIAIVMLEVNGHPASSDAASDTQSAVPASDAPARTNRSYRAMEKTRGPPAPL